MDMVLKSMATLILLAVILPATAFAHKIKIFAAAEGNGVKGFAYYAGGSRMQNAEIIVLGPDGKKLSQVKTDAVGSFVYKTDLAMELRFVVQTPDGHRAEFAVPARVTSQKKLIDINSSAKSYAASDLQHLSNKDLENLIAKSVAREVNTLREQLVLHDEKVRFHDIVGGIGYIFGLAGLACFFQNRKKRQNQDRSA
jgi:nickel transport protein